jgi:signal transduction histidine kinase/HAMP domain-containing protein
LGDTFGMRLPRIRPIRIGMRLWITLAFAAIAAVTAVIVTSVFAARSESALKSSAKDIALGTTIRAADQLSHASGPHAIRTRAATLANRRRFAIWVFDSGGNLITPKRSHRAGFRTIHGRFGAVVEALEGKRYVQPTENNRAIVVAVPLQSQRGAPPGAVLTYSPRQELAAQLGIVHSQVVQTALFASLAGALAGLLVAMLIVGRLRRIASAASEIESGNFSTRLHPWLRDELGFLAQTIDRMRGHLRNSFTQLETERDRLLRLLGRLHDGVIAVDSDLNVEFSNASARRLIRVPVKSGEKLPDPWGNGMLPRVAADLFKPGAKPVQETFNLSDGSSYAVAGLPPRRRSETAVLVLTDVSVRERRERAEREFVANAAHELRTPLATITGSIQVLQAGAKDDADQRDRFLKHIEREAARLTRLTRALLVLARAQTQAEAPRLASVDIKPLLEAIAADAQPEGDVQVEVKCPDGLEVWAEQDLVEQAVSNLVANAVEHTPEGKISLSAHKLASGISVEVSDTGQGIPHERQDRIFDRFYRPGGRDPRNFGLGLAIVRDAVQALGGQIELDSAPGRGTTVRITLPEAQPEAA